MNYLAHGRLVTEDPYALAGTAAPDWVRACRRKSRLRPERLPDATPTAQARSLLEGIRRHIREDRVFHAAPAFLATQREVATLIRRAHPTVRRATFRAHILLEILLDAWLMQRDPTLIDRYYAALASVDANVVARHLNAWATEPAPRLARWIEGFRSMQFLRTYLNDTEVVLRLNAREPARAPGPRAVLVSWHRGARKGGGLAPGPSCRDDRCVGAAPPCSPRLRPRERARSPGWCAAAQFPVLVGRHLGGPPPRSNGGRSAPVLLC